jgi:hypothetical protein
MVAIKAIPTKYNGQRFRSRLEAKWAAFFDLCEWKWSYEPDELDGYIPDFKLWFKVPVLVEVKPVQWDDSDEEREILLAARTKIIHSGFKGEAILLGTRIVTEDSQGYKQYLQQLGAIMSIDPETDEVTDWNPLVGFRCGGKHKEVPGCGRRSFCDDTFSWHCRVRGCWAGDHHLGEWNAEHDLRLASNEVQWNP